MKLALIDEEKPHHGVSRMSRVLAVTAAGYHAWRKRPRSACSLEDERIKERIAFHHTASRGTYGVPRLFDDLVDEGIHVSCKRLGRLMCELGIVGWSMRDDIKSDIVVDALGMGTTMRRPDAGLVHHSDRGAQYRSLAFGTSLRDSGILASMGETGVPHDNAVTESVMPTIKKERGHRHTFKTRDQARFEVFGYIEGFYNPYRRHSSFGNLSPAEFERRLEQERLSAAAS